MKAVLAICALTLAALAACGAASAQPTATPVVTATSNFGSSQHPGDHVQYVIDLQNPGEGYAGNLIVIQTPTNLSLAAPTLACLAQRCAIDQPQPPAAGQPTTFVRVPGGDHETITVDATILAAGPYSVAIATTRNLDQKPALLTTLKGEAFVEATATNAANTTKPAANDATTNAVVPGFDRPPERVRPKRPSNPLARWLRDPKLLLLLGLAAATLATLVTGAVIIHSMRRAHWQKLLAISARFVGETGVRSSPIPAAAPSVRINVRVEGGQAGPRGPIPIRRNR